MLTTEQRHALLQQAQQEGLSLSDLEAFGSTLGLAATQLLNELAIATAQGYLAGTLSYEDGDEVMNGLASAIYDAGMHGDFPHPALALYHAFDDGEYQRRNDPPQTNPGEQYTRPQVEQILRDHKGQPQ